MRLFKIWVHGIAVLAIMGAALVFTTPARALGSTITVNTTDESVATDGNCSIREAIQAANTNLAVDACTAGSALDTDTIAFNIGGGGAQSITLTSSLIATSPVNIDGTTQPGYTAGSPGNPLIQLTGAMSYLIRFQPGSSGSTLKALRLTNTGMGFWSFGAYLETDGITIVSNYFNTDGSAFLGGDTTIGLLLGTNTTASSGNTIGGASASQRNLFAGTGGVRIDQGSNNLIQGNYFGVQTGGSALVTGITANDAAVGMCYWLPISDCASNVVRGNVIGGFWDGVGLYHNTHDSIVAGNYIGIGADGVTRLGNGEGIAIIGAQYNTIGGTTAADRNVISGNYENIWVANDGLTIASKNVIQGNYIGTTADGLGRTTPYGTITSDLYGFYLHGGDQTQIGGTAAGAGNLIAGNNTGIFVETPASSTLIQGNMIGTDATGQAALQQQQGIYVSGGASADIGDIGTAGNNLISGNDTGIYLNGSTASTSIFGNRIGLTAGGSFGLPNTTGITLLTAASAVISRNWIGYNSSDGVWIDPTSTIAWGSSSNCFASNFNYAVYSFNSGSSAPFGSNWWGSPTGPTHSGNPGGMGDLVSDYVSYSSFLTKAPGACPRTSTDFEGDGKADLGYFHPATGMWGILQSAYGHSYGSARYFTWGQTGDLVAPADYDGDGVWDPTVRRPPGGGQSAAYLILKSSDNYNYGSSLTIPAGWPGLGDKPMPGDYNGDGISDPAIWRGNTGVWIIPMSPSFSSFAFYSWGAVGDKPIAADVDGDGKTDIGYWRPSTGVWGFLQSSMGYSYASPLFFSWGASGDIPAMADYDGDGYADPAVVIPPASGMSQAYRILLSSAAYNPASSVTVPAGWPGLSDTPAPGDYDGDGKADPAIWRGNTGVWIVPLSSGSYSTYLFRAWGAVGDQIAR